MNDKELLAILIDQYANLQRILASDDSTKEIEYQLKLVKTKLKALGIATTELDINK